MNNACKNNFPLIEIKCLNRLGVLYEERVYLSYWIYLKLVIKSSFWISVEYSIGWMWWELNLEPACVKMWESLDAGNMIHLLLL